MEQHAQAIDQTLAESESDLTAHQSLDRIVYALFCARFLFLFAGVAFFAWEMFETLIEGNEFSPESAVEIALASFVAPTLVWFGSKWAAGLVKQANINQNKLVTANQVAQREITERKQAEDALKAIADELTRTNDELAIEISERKRFEEALKEHARDLERSNADFAQFAYIASHDLQEPLRMVSSYTQLLARRYEGRLDADADEFIGFAVDGVTRMQRLINDLLEYSRVGTNGKVAEPTDSNQAFANATANLRAAIEESGATVTHDDLPTVEADPFQLTQLFQNLVGNAIKFQRDCAPCVHVSAQHEGSEWVFSVQDNGIGIDPEYGERVFAIFQRLHTREEYAGTGIGLAICKKIVERQGGRIWVQSEPGEGSIFKFTVSATGS